jgi:hypothetical protein
MRGSWRFWSVTVLGVLALLVAAGDMALVLTDRTLRRQTDEQREFVQQTAQLNGVSENLIRLIARAAVEDKDQALHDLLVREGFHFQADTPAPAGQSAAPPGQK